MISRRLVRIKAMQTYYAFLQDGGEQNISNIQKELQWNIEQSYQLFIHLHCLLLAIFDFAGDRMEIAKNKHIKTDHDSNPNLKFLNNTIIAAFANDPQISRARSNNDLNWSEHPEFIKSIWMQINSASYFKEFMSDKEISFKQDLDIINKIISKNIIYNSVLEEILEDKSIYWNDDLELLCSNIMQNLKKYNESNISTFKLPHIFKNDDDEEFSRILIKRAALNKDHFDKIILESLKKWELERIAVLDRVLLHLALCEITQIPDMPVKVTINEYLDIAKYYSTDKSSIFINGILDKIYNELRTSGQLNKTGLGLVQ